ncbi:MAG: NAD(P)H:quinone oxidoreductase [Rubrivivax sp.]
MAAQNDFIVINKGTHADVVIKRVPELVPEAVAKASHFKLDEAGGLWQAGSLVGKVGSVFASTSTQHGGQESTILSTHTVLLHLGMVIVGLPYAWKGQMRLDEITGGSPYGATTIAGGDGSRQPSANELEGAKFQGRHVATIAAKLSA